MSRLLPGTLLAQFALASFVVVLALGLAIGWLLGQTVEQNALQEAAAEATETTSARLLPYLSADDFAVSMTGKRYADFARLLKESVVSERIARVKLWAADGTVIFSDDEELVGQRFPIDGELAEALAGQVATDVSDLQAEENEKERGLGRLLEIYAPVTLPGSPRIVGAFEIYKMYGPIGRAIAGAQRDLYGSLALGLLVLYATLFSLVRGTHGTVVRQQGQLQAINEAALAIAAKMNLEEIARRILESVASIVAARHTALAVLDQDGGFRHFVTYGMSDEEKATFGSALRLGRFADPAVLGKGLRLSRVSTRSAGDTVATPAMRSFLVVPVRSDSRLVGALYAINKRARGGFTARDRELMERLAAHAALAIEKGSLMTELEDRAVALQVAYRTTLETLCSALDLRDGGTESHSRRAAERARLLAREMGVDPDEEETIVMGALLHDVGKIGVADAVLRKPGPLTTEEWAVMRQHPVWGAKMLDDISSLAKAGPIVLHHHERFDGTGYPEQLAGEAIPLGARIFALVDTYDAITSDRPYRPGQSHEAAVAEVLANAGRQFDPAVVAAFERVAERFEQLHLASDAR